LFTTAIEKANWLTLPQDLRRIDGLPKAGFDVVLCLGNSISMLPNFEGTKHNQKLTLFNLFAMVKPKGILVLDHRNYDVILDTGTDICNLIKEVLGDDAKHTVYGDFKPVGEVQIPSHFAHVIEKSASSSQ
ncbi:Glycine N-methyltransferase, partial [Lamellibrachia satsuma]